MKRPWVLGGAVLLFFGLVAGCATSNALQNAKDSFARAKAAGAEQKAPYEYYAAEAYLGLAQHEVSDGDSDGAREFSDKSMNYSMEALQKATGGGK